MRSQYVMDRIQEKKLDEEVNYLYFIFVFGPSLLNSHIKHGLNELKYINNNFNIFFLVY